MQISARLAVHAIAPDRRRSTRSATHIPTLLTSEGYYGIPVTLRDISESGFRLEAGVHVPPDSLIRIKLPSLGTVVGRVAWSKKGDIGGSFVNPVSTQRLLMIPGVRLA
jgi:PilZ domain